MRSDSCDKLMNKVHVGTPEQAYMWDIASESMKCVMNWLIGCNTKILGCQRLGGMTDEVSTVGSRTTQVHENGLLGPTCWVGCVYMHHVVDRDWVAWQTRLAQLGRQMIQSHENGLLGPTCWVGCVYIHHSGKKKWVVEKQADNMKIWWVINDTRIVIMS